MNHKQWTHKYMDDWLCDSDHVPCTVQQWLTDCHGDRTRCSICFSRLASVSLISSIELSPLSLLLQKAVEEEESQVRKPSADLCSSSGKLADPDPVRKVSSWFGPCIHPPILLLQPPLLYTLPPRCVSHSQPRASSFQAVRQRRATSPHCCTHTQGRSSSVMVIFIFFPAHTNSLRLSSDAWWMSPHPHVCAHILALLDYGSRKITCTTSPLLLFLSLYWCVCLFDCFCNNSFIHLHNFLPRTYLLQQNCKTRHYVAVVCHIYVHVACICFYRGRRLHLLWCSTLFSRTSRRSQDTPPWSIPGTATAPTQFYSQWCFFLSNIGSC